MFRTLLWSLSYCYVYYAFTDNFTGLFYFSSSLFSQEWPSTSSPTPTHLAHYPSSRFSMATLTVISYNFQGLCSLGKRSKLWWELKRSGAQVLFLQETHFTPHLMPKLPTHLYSQWFLSTSPVSKSKGTAIAIHKSCPFQPTGNRVDPLGWYVFLKGSIAGQLYKFATIYAPNTNQLTFIRYSPGAIGRI